MTVLALALVLMMVPPDDPIDHEFPMHCGITEYHMRYNELVYGVGFKNPRITKMVLFIDGEHLDPEVFEPPVKSVSFAGASHAHLCIIDLMFIEEGNT